MEQLRLDKVVSEVFNVKVKQFHSYSNKREISEARLTAMYLQKELLRLSFPKIARHFKRKSHSTCLSAHKTVSGLCETDKQFREKVMRCIEHYNSYNVDRSKQRYNLHYLIVKEGFRVSGPEKTIYMPASAYDTLQGILKSRITRLVNNHQYSLQLTII